MEKYQENYVFLSNLSPYSLILPQITNIHKFHALKSYFNQVEQIYKQMYL